MHSRWCVVAGFTQSGVKQDVQLRTSRGRKTIPGAVLYQICLDIFDFARPVSYDTAPGILSENLHQQGRTWSERTKSEKKDCKPPGLQNKTKQKKKSIFRSLQTEKKKTKNSSTLNKMVVEGKHCEHLKQEIINKAWVFSKKWLTNKSDSRTCGISSAWSVEQYNLKQLRLKLSTAVCWWERKTRQIPMVGRPSVSDWAAC